MAVTAAEASDDPAWHHPERCLDFLVTALGWFCERDRAGFLWHLDELLYEAMNDLGHALRATTTQYR